MRFPVVFQLGSFQLPAHTFFEVLAYAVAYRVYLSAALSGKDYYGGKMRLKLTIWTLLGAFIGSRLVAYFEDTAAVDSTALGFFTAFMGSKSILGAFAGGLFSTELAKYFLRQKRSTGDKLVVPILTGLVVGRIGCFLGGLDDRTQGSITTLPWGIHYGDGALRHPLPFYEILYCFVMFVMLRGNKFSWRHGGCFQFFLASYFLYRFLAEFLKDRVPLALTLSSIQWTSLAGLLYYAWLWRKRLPMRFRIA